MIGNARLHNQLTTSIIILCKTYIMYRSKRWTILVFAFSFRVPNIAVWLAACILLSVCNLIFGIHLRQVFCGVHRADSLSVSPTFTFSMGRRSSFMTTTGKTLTYFQFISLSLSVWAGVQLYDDGQDVHLPGGSEGVGSVLQQS